MRLRAESICALPDLLCIFIKLNDVVTLSYHLYISSWCRLHAGHGALPARADPPPHPVSLWQEGLGAIHCLLDTESLCTLGGLPAPRLLPQATYDRASETNPGRQQEGAGGRLQVGGFTLSHSLLFFMCGYDDNPSSLMQQWYTLFLYFWSTCCIFYS